jgi:hypothetical protein
MMWRRKKKKGRSEESMKEWRFQSFTTLSFVRDKRKRRREGGCPETQRWWN